MQFVVTLSKYVGIVYVPAGNVVFTGFEMGLDGPLLPVL